MILGGLAAIGIAKLMRFRYYGGCGGGRWRRHHGHGFWHGHHHGEPRWGGGRGGWDMDLDEEDWPGARGGWRSDRNQPFVMRALFRRLETTPTQEDAIRAAWEEFRGQARPLREEGRKTREDLAAAMRKPSFDEVLMGELYARHDSALEQLRKSFVGLAAKVHQVLDEKQRERLAAILERGPRFGATGFGW
jgi:hypothetical protein